MAQKRIDTGVVVSALAHTAVLLWGAVSFAARPLDTPPVESMPVDIVSIKEFTELTAGTKTAPKKEAPKPLVEKKAEPRPVENPSAQVSEKPEIVTAATAAEPPPEVKVPTPKPAPAEAKQDTPEKKEPAKKEPEKKQPDAEALKKAEEALKKQAKKQEAKPVPQKKPDPKKLVEKPVQEKSQWSGDTIQSLLDKRQPRRLAALGETINETPAAGTARGRALDLSANYINALAARLGECWTAVSGGLREEKFAIPITLRFKSDGTLAAQPQIDMPLNTQRERALAESAVRAIVGCQPYTMLPQAKYEDWKVLPFNFNPNAI